MTNSSLKLVAGLLVVFLHKDFLAYGEEPARENAAPLLRLESNGPRSLVSGLAFAPDGKRLYASGWDKAVLVWELGPGGRFEFNSQKTLRTPVGVGGESSLDGALNGLALSEDGRWLATAGVGPIRGSAGVREGGWVTDIDDLPIDKKRDIGVIYVFDTIHRKAIVLRGHSAAVLSLAFVSGSRSSPPELISVAQDVSTDKPGQHVPTLRFWDVKNARELSSLTQVPKLNEDQLESLPSLKFRPGLAAWSTGQQAKQVRVAIAWGDNQFRIWDVENGQVVRSISAANTVTVLPLDSKGSRIVTGGNDEIGIWSPPVNQGRLGNLTYANHFQKPKIDSLQGRPGDGFVYAVTLIPATKDRAAMVASVATRCPDKKPCQYRLLISTTTSPMTTVNEFDLAWGGNRRKPALAATRDGQKLAVAGSEEKEIEIYRIDDLVKKGNVPKPERLESQGLSFEEAEFVKDGERWGLGLKESRARAVKNSPSKPIVFDISERQVKPKEDEWQLANATIDGWSTGDATTAGKIVVNRRDLPQLELKLDIDYRATGIAFCPAIEGRPPLIAVASEANGRPSLRLFHGETGEHLRSYAAHTERIRSVAFSSDGRMLLTVADDRTVCVWTTSDLKERLGQHGTVVGVNFQLDRKPRVFVKKAPKDHPLQSDDEILAAVDQGKEVPFSSVKDYYQYVREQKPGNRVEFKIRRNGNVQNARCEIGQEVDSARPLFTLFIARAKQPVGAIPNNREEFEWIGWTPLGPFDLKGERIDQWLGWHFNTGVPERPAEFAVIGQYRDTYYRRDLLQDLVKEQKLPPLPPVKPEQPEVSFFFRKSNGTDVFDLDTRLDSTDVKVVATVTGISEKKIKGLKLNLGDQAIPLIREDDSYWSADLSKFGWKRQDYLCFVSIELDAKSGRTINGETRRVEYLPKPPRIEWTPPKEWGNQFKGDSVQVNARVISGSERANVVLRLQLPGNTKVQQIANWDTVQGQKIIADQVQVEPGENYLEIEAWNSDAPESNREQETQRMRVLVQRDNPKVGPSIALKELNIPTADGKLQRLTADPNTPDTYRSPVPVLKINGTIVGQAAIGSAELLKGDKRQELKGFKANTKRNFEFEETFDLKAGPQTIVLRSGTSGVINEKRIVVVYERPLPKIEALTATVNELRPLPKGVDDETGVYYAGFHEQRATIKGKLSGPPGEGDRVVVRVNEDLIAKEDLTFIAPNQFEARVKLAAGTNSILLKIDNDWTPKGVSRKLGLIYRRPPVITNLQAREKVVNEPLDLTCQIISQLPVRSSKVIVDGETEYDGVLEKNPGQPDTYSFKVHQIGLAVGEHVLNVTASNDDGSALEPLVHRVTVEQQPEKPPTLEIDPTLTEYQSPAKRMKIPYTVKSAVPVTIQVKIRGSGEGEESTLVDKEFVEFEQGKADDEVVLDLYDGINDVELTAKNSGGFIKENLKISYANRPVTVEILSVDDQAPQLKDDGVYRFDVYSALKPRVNLTARVILKDGLAADRSMKARVWVNSLMQSTKIDKTETLKDGAMSGTFTTEITLTRREKNEIRVEAYDEERRFASSFGNSNTLEIDCQKHERRQDLYLVFLGTGDVTDLREKAKAALKVTNVQNKDEWESKIFSSVHVVDAMDNDASDVSGRLRQNLICKMYERKKSRLSVGTHAVVMIYFQGNVELINNDFKFVTKIGQKPTAKAITGSYLEKRILGSAYGAHLLFLDLSNNAAITEREVWPRAPQLGIIISNWKGNEQPEQTRLMSAIEKILPQTRVVSQLVGQIDKSYQNMSTDFPGRIETKLDLMTDVRDLRIGID